MVTGEAIPVEKIGDEVIGHNQQTGTFNLGLPKWEKKLPAQIIKLVEDAQGQPPIARPADRIASYFVPAVMGLRSHFLSGFLDQNQL
jgi:cation transport ATPase